MQEKPNDIGKKNYKHNGKAEWMKNMTKELEGLKESLKVKTFKSTLKKYQTGKPLAMMEYMVSPLFMTD